MGPVLFGGADGWGRQPAGYIPDVLHKYQHPPPTRLEYMMYKCESLIKCIQAIIGLLLYYTRNVNPTMLVAIGIITAAMNKGTKATAAAIMQLLDYCAPKPLAIM
eukprot:4298524-Ditylum_brightwellii.AAC.1